MINISNILQGKSNSRDNTISKELTADDMTSMKFIPITSSDVERNL